MRSHISGIWLIYWPVEGQLVRLKSQSDRRSFNVQSDANLVWLNLTLACQSDSLAVACLVNLKCGYTFCFEPWPFCIGSPD